MRTTVSCGWSSPVPMRHSTSRARCVSAGPAPDAWSGGAEALQLSEQILAALVDEYGRDDQDGMVRAWLRKRRRGPLA